MPITEAPWQGVPARERPCAARSTSRWCAPRPAHRALRPALPELPWGRGDLNVYDDCRRAVEGCQAIMHLGAVPWPSDHPRLRQEMDERGDALPPLDATARTNLLGSYNLMMAAVGAGVEVVVMTGSNCAYGHGYRISERPFPIRYLPLDEAHPSDVEDSYSTSKLLGEELLASFSRAYGLRTYVTRPSGICPPERLQRMAESVRPVAAWSDWMWGYVASEDLADLHRLILEQAQDLPPHDVYVANALDSSALEPSLELVERFRPDLVAVSGALRGHDAFFSSAKARADLGWSPERGWRRYR